MDPRILSVLIVDDELPIRQELRLFDWEGHGAVLIGEAEDGQEALDFCREYPPDVLITDITMPVMDGFELFACVNQEFPQTQVILLTCHSDFDYARQALQLGALDYLVKVTLDDKELIEALNKARQAIEREQSHRSQIRERARWRQTKFLRRLMKSFSGLNIKSVDHGSFCFDELQIPMPSCLAVLYSNTGTEDRLFVEREIQRSLAQLEDDIHPLISWIPIRTGEVFIFFESRDACRRHMSTLQRIKEVISEDLDENLSFVSHEVHLHAWMFGEVQGIREIVHALKLTTDKRASVFYDHEHTMMAETVESCHPLSPSLLKEIEARMTDVRWDLTALSNFIQRDFYDWALQQRIIPEELKNLAVKWQMQWNRDWGRASQDQQDSSRVTESGTLVDLIDMMAHDIERKRNGVGQLRIEIREAKNIIQQRMSDPITQSHVAELVGLSPHYFSRLFREEVGEGFNQYVTRTRIEKAVDLLQTSNMKVYEIAEEVGIPSYRYFSVLFRKWTGVTPREFKKG